MKKYLFILPAIIALAGCVSQSQIDSGALQAGEEITLNAYFDDAPTKTTLVEGTKVYWVPGDEIAVFSGKSAARFSSSISQQAAECGFTGTIDAANQYQAFYPFKNDLSFDGRAIKANLPYIQESVDGNVANGLLYSAGITAGDGGLRFRNVLSGICVSFESDDIEYVEFRGNDNEVIAGNILVTVDDSTVETEPAGDPGETFIRLLAPQGKSFKSGTSYYIVCVPTSFAKGISLVLYKADGVSATFTINERVELKRSVFGRINLADKGIQFSGAALPEGELPAGNEVWYTTNNNKPLDGARLQNQGSCTVVSHTFKDGVGVIRYSAPLTRYDGVEKTYTNINYEDSHRITGLLLPDCVEHISRFVLYDMIYLKEFRVPAALKEIDNNGFSLPGDTSLERYTGHHVSEDGRCLILDGVLYGFAPAGLSSYEVPSGVTRITTGSMTNTPYLKNLVLPEGLRDIEMNSFTLSGIESITLPASIENIDHFAFRSCKNLKNLLGDSRFISKDRKFLYQAEDMFHPMMLFLFAGKDDTSYEIPEGIQGIQYYAFSDCPNLRSVTFPESLNYIAGDAFMGCANLEAIYGSHTTSDNKGFVTSYHELQFVLPSISGEYVIPDEVTSLGTEVFHGRHNLTSIKMGDQVVSLGDYVFEYCSNLKSITLSANLSSIGLYPFMDSRVLESVYFRSIVPPAYSDKQFSKVPSLKIYVPAQAMRLYTSDSGWKDYWDVMEPYEYTDLPEPDFYLSSDYSREGEVTVYQRASKGNGIDIVFMGDAYSDREVANGKYIKDMKAAAESYFGIEPYKSFRELFNIYFVTTVSATEGYARGGRSLGTVRGEGTYISGDDAKCFELARKAVKDDKRMDETLVVVCGNQELSGTIYLCGTCNLFEPEDWTGRDYACGPAVAYFLKLDDSFEETAELLRHEAGGHGFAKLADEYFYPGVISSTVRDYLVSIAPYRWFSNVDVTSDPSRVKWSAFLSDNRYKSDGVGVFEGGYTVSNGVWRPSEHSIMDNNSGEFNAPSRYIIWYRIHKLAYGNSWNGTYEDFAAYDAINRKVSLSAAPAPKYGMGVRRIMNHHAPVVTGRSWREAN